MSEVNIMHIIVAAMLLAAYVAITLAGDNAEPVLYVLTGQLGGRVATLGMRRVNGNADS